MPSTHQEACRVYKLILCVQLMGVEAFLAHHHAGDVGPPPAWGGIADDGPDAPCAVAGTGVACVGWSES